jgi:hypothetical protein
MEARMSGDTVAAVQHEDALNDEIFRAAGIRAEEIE